MESVLTDKQEAFCRYYVLDWNATEAARKAGYSKKTAYSIGQENLKKPEIQDRIKELKEEIEELTGVSKIRIVNELAKVGFANISDFVHEDFSLKDLSEVPEYVKSAVSEIQTEERVTKGRSGDEIVHKKVKLKLHNKISAFTELNRMLGNNEPEKLEHSNLVINWNETKKY